ncbi:MAG: hypothetical protein L6V80_00620 [Bacteroidales bacterium]|nr:MAG: hypothetical protein L6V80_00620 [Bacteroidales bacterium]
MVSGVKMAQDDIVKRLRGPRGTEVSSRSSGAA